MKCKCGEDIDVGNIELHAECMNGVNVEVWFVCPKCDNRFYTCFDSDEFTADDEE